MKRSATGIADSSVPDKKLLTQMSLGLQTTSGDITSSNALPCRFCANHGLHYTEHHTGCKYEECKCVKCRFNRRGKTSYGLPLTKGNQYHLREDVRRDVTSKNGEIDPQNPSSSPGEVARLQNELKSAKKNISALMTEKCNFDYHLRELKFAHGNEMRAKEDEVRRLKSADAQPQTVAQRVHSILMDCFEKERDLRNGISSLVFEKYAKLWEEKVDDGKENRQRAGNEAPSSSLRKGVIVKQEPTPVEILDPDYVPAECSELTLEESSIYDGVDPYDQTITSTVADNEPKYTVYSQHPLTSTAFIPEPHSMVTVSDRAPYTVPNYGSSSPAPAPHLHPLIKEDPDWPTLEPVVFHFDPDCDSPMSPDPSPRGSPVYESDLGNLYDQNATSTVSYQPASTVFPPVSEERSTVDCQSASTVSNCEQHSMSIRSVQATSTVLDQPRSTVASSASQSATTVYDDPTLTASSSDAHSQTTTVAVKPSQVSDLTTFLQRFVPSITVEKGCSPAPPTVTCSPTPTVVNLSAPAVTRSATPSVARSSTPTDPLIFPEFLSPTLPTHEIPLPQAPGTTVGFKDTVFSTTVTRAVLVMPPPPPPPPTVPLLPTGPGTTTVPVLPAITGRPRRLPLMPTPPPSHRGDGWSSWGAPQTSGWFFNSGNENWCAYPPYNYYDSAAYYDYYWHTVGEQYSSFGQ